MKSNEERADGYILIEWPESQRIMEHPFAQLEYETDGPHISPAYWVPKEVWEEYKGSYYEEE
tara:strand:- start:378 stop:563 length:186 start_codon:yes stop_codon:yes gene_type:complete